MRFMTTPTQQRRKRSDEDGGSDEEDGVGFEFVVEVDESVDEKTVR